MVEKIDNGQLYAMKQLRKDVIIKSESIVCARLEKEVMKQSHHPFLVGLDYVFQTPVSIYLVMKFYRYFSRFLFQLEAESYMDIWWHRNVSLKATRNFTEHRSR